MTTSQMGTEGSETQPQQQQEQPRTQVVEPVSRFGATAGALASARSKGHVAPKDRLFGGQSAPCEFEGS